jgi:predicted component of viral defense system (DUF524 family)
VLQVKEPPFSALQTALIPEASLPKSKQKVTAWLQEHPNPNSSVRNTQRQTVYKTGNRIQSTSVEEVRKTKSDYHKSARSEG